ncbi:MAG: phosphoribosylanthranilate isomerase [Clostridiales bacterium]|nr:phosphoribosylanthranilate isomerase [Clostridiales bacterium]
MSVQVKICGLTRPEDIRAVNDAGADYAGFVFFEKSRRNIPCGTAKNLLSLLDPKIQSVAVCVSPTPALVREISELGFDLIQIHGEIRPEVLDQIQTPVWQAVNLKNGMEPDLILEHPKICGYVLDGADYGGGKTFGWEDDSGEALAFAIREALHGKKFILAGGLNAGNVRKGIELFHPDVTDVSSGVETEGTKDSTLIHRFIREVRKS